MDHGLLIIDGQPSFNPPEWQVDGVRHLATTMYLVATMERHDEAITRFYGQLGWKPAPDDDSLVPADQIFVKYGYALSPELIQHLKDKGIKRVLVCGLQADTCCLAAGFMLFNAGMLPTMLKWLTMGSSLDRSTVRLMN